MKRPEFSEYPYENRVMYPRDFILDQNKYIDYLQSQLKERDEEFKRLQHHEDTTIGLWCTDRPDLIDDPKKVMFQLTKNKVR